MLHTTLQGNSTILGAELLACFIIFSICSKDSPCIPDTFSHAKFATRRLIAVCKSLNFFLSKITAELLNSASKSKAFFASIKIYESSALLISASLKNTSTIFGLYSSKIGMRFKRIRLRKYIVFLLDASSRYKSPYLEQYVSISFRLN